MCVPRPEGSAIRIPNNLWAGLGGAAADAVGDSKDEVQRDGAMLGILGVTLCSQASRRVNGRARLARAALLLEKATHIRSVGTPDNVPERNMSGAAVETEETIFHT